MRPLVSIIIPVYNAEKFIACTIQSAIDQTWENKEIIVIDDGSTDSSFAIASRYESPGISVFSQRNKGASAARNFGLQKAKGDYIQFLDADDLISKNKIESQLNQLINFPDFIGLCTTVHFQDNIDPLSYPIRHEWFSEGSDDPVDFLIKLYGGGLIGPQYGGMLTVHSWLIPKTIVNKAGDWDESLTVDDDGEFFCRVILASSGIKYANDCISYYRKFTNQNSLSAQKDRTACASLLQSTLLKAGHLTGKTDNSLAKMVSSRLLMENAFAFYPAFKNLSSIAEKKAMEISPDFRYKPFKKGVNGLITSAFGWRFLKQLKYLKQKIK